MKKTQNVLGLIAGAMLVLSSAAHSFLGWGEISAALLSLHVSPDLMIGLAIAWHFGGAAMLTLGCIVIWLFAQQRKGVAVSKVPAQLIGAMYLLFGAGALVASNFDPFCLLFMIPGVLLALAVYPVKQRSL